LIDRDDRSIDRSARITPAEAQPWNTQ